MKYTLALLSVVGAAAAQGVTTKIAPKGSYPNGCSKAVDGKMWVTVVDMKASKRDLEALGKRDGQCADGNLVVTLADGVLTDSKGRTGYIASNYQFQFDAPAQAGAIFTAGYSMCGNNSLALGATTTFFKCRSGDFWNLYDRSWAAQCEPVQLAAYQCSGASVNKGGQFAGGPNVVATQYVTTTMVKPIADGQPQVITTAVPVPMCQIGDGQVQAHTTPCASVTYAPAPPVSAKPSAVPVSQYTDGQIQVTKPGTGKAPPAGPTSAAAPPPASGPPSKPSTLASSAASTPKPTSAPAPSTPVQSGAGAVVGSMVALVVGIVGAFALL